MDAELKKVYDGRILRFQTVDAWKEWFQTSQLPAPFTIFQDFRNCGTKLFMADFYSFLVQQNPNASFFALLESDPDAIANFLKNFDQYQHGFKIVSMHSVVEINPRTHSATKKNPKSNALQLFR